MQSEGIDARRSPAADIERALVDAHERTWAMLGDLAPEQWRVPYHPGINPPLWEYGHVAWFTEWWVLRDAYWNERDELVTRRSSMLRGADDWFDSGRIPHADRWTLDLPAINEVRAYVRSVLDAVRAKLGATDGGDLYAFRLALFHEDMHGEALAYMRQTLDHPLPLPDDMPTLGAKSGDVSIPGGILALGSTRDDAFVFDNEKWVHEVTLSPALMSRQCVTNASYAEFVEADGYRDTRWWSEQGIAWLAEQRITQPVRWRNTRQGWQHRWFGRWAPLPHEAPVCHVNAYEAEAYCRWANRRLPTQAEWERAATLDLIDWGGSVWEWMADDFAPYPGFVADRYRDYSAPWFHTHRNVRGGSFVTRPRMHHPRYRNFYLPHRNDIFVGFRTCALT